MTKIKLYNLSDWQKFDTENLYQIEGDETSKRILLEFNASAPCDVHVFSAGKDAQFLAVIDGPTSIEFWAPGNVGVSVTPHDTADVWFYTSAGAATHTIIEDAESYVRPLERKPRNHAMEEMNFIMQQNFLRMEEAQRQNDLQWQRRLEALQARNHIDPDTGEVHEQVGASAGAGTASASDGGGIEEPPAASGASASAPKPADSGKSAKNSG